MAGAGAAPAYALARARAAVDLARALDPLPPSFDVADLLLSLHPMTQLQDDDAVKITISLIEAAGPWTNPGRLGQYQADLAWLQDSSHLDRRSVVGPLSARCQQQSEPRHDWHPSRIDHAAMPSAITASMGRPPGHMATTAKPTRTVAAWAAHIRFWIPSPTVAPESSRWPRRRLAIHRTGMMITLLAVSAIPSGEVVTWWWLARLRAASITM